MFRFTIRDVLWLMLVVALGVMWWTDRQGLNKERALLKAERTEVAKEKSLYVEKLIQQAEGFKRALEIINANRERQEQRSFPRPPPTWMFPEPPNPNSL